MKTKAFQTRRKPMKGVRTLYAKTRKRKQRVAAAAGGDFAVEEPNLGVARALVVILILHVAAIVAIVVHSSTNENEIAVKDSPAAKASEKANLAAKSQQADVPQISPNDRHGFVQMGDNYEKFAIRHQVDVQELRRLNNNAPLEYGLALRLPPVAEPVRQQVPPAMANVTRQDPLIQEALPPIVEVPTRNSLPAEYEVMEAAQPIVQNQQLPSTHIAEPFPEMEPLTAPEPVPTVNVSAPVEQTPPPAPEPQVVQEAPPKPKMKTYTIRKGDTLWAVANQNGVSVDKLMSANPRVDPKKMRPGITVNIPAR